VGSWGLLVKEGRVVRVEPGVGDGELRALIRAEKNSKMATRLRAVAMARRGRTAEAIAADLGVSRRAVQEWIRRFNGGGYEGLRHRPKPGRPRLLSPEQERELSEMIEAGPTDPGLSAWRGPVLVDKIQEVFGVTMSLSGAYKTLHRLGFEPLRPRPKHRKSDPAAMAAWEERAPFLSAKSANPTPAKRSRSGSRTRPGSASRAR
jgi:transposase